MNNNWITVNSWIQITGENKEKLLKIIEELKELNAISEQNYDSIIGAAKCLNF